jgi:hypothetical protein
MPDWMDFLAGYIFGLFVARILLRRLERSPKESQ